jgi:hypothetical protein
MSHENSGIWTKGYILHGLRRSGSQLCLTSTGKIATFREWRRSLRRIVQALAFHAVGYRCRSIRSGFRKHFLEERGKEEETDDQTIPGHEVATGSD